MHSQTKITDSVAQQVEHIPFKDGVLGSNPSWITKQQEIKRTHSWSDSLQVPLTRHSATLVMLNKICNLSGACVGYRHPCRLAPRYPDIPCRDLTLSPPYCRAIRYFWRASATYSYANEKSAQFLWLCDQMKTRDQILTFLSRNKKLFRDKYHIIRIGFFGSYARGEQNPDSDICREIYIKPRIKSSILKKTVYAD